MESGVMFFHLYSDATTAVLVNLRSQQNGLLQIYEASAPLDQPHLDIMGPFPLSSFGNRYILVIIDQFTWWVEAFPVPDQGTDQLLLKN